MKAPKGLNKAKKDTYYLYVFYKGGNLERDTRIELVSQPWQGCVIPLYQSR